jgi:hypothetical protein
MNPQRDTLLEAIRELATESPVASPELRARLNDAFVRHHALRRLRRRAEVIVALAVSIAVSIYWLRPHPRLPAVEVSGPVQSAPVAQSAAQTIAPKVHAPTMAKAFANRRVQPKRISKVINSTTATSTVTAETTDFVALPTFDPAMPLDGSRMVRMDLPGSALQRIGYPVDGQLLDRRIVTDVLVGQDGMPYAVRLVQTRKLH